MVKSNVLARGPFHFTVFQKFFWLLFVTGNNFFAISFSPVLLPSLMLWFKVFSFVHIPQSVAHKYDTNALCWLKLWNYVHHVDFAGGGSAFHSFTPYRKRPWVLLYYVIYFFFYHRSSKMANELRIFSSCKRIISSQHQIKEWWMNDEFVIIWKKVVVAVCGYYLGIRLQAVA